MRQVTGQVSIYDELHDLKWEQAALEKHTCPHCALTYWWGPNNPRWTLAIQDFEHREVEPGICARMAEVRETLIDYETGRKVPSPWWSKNDLRIHIFQSRDIYEHVWRAYNSRQETH